MKKKVKQKQKKKFLNISADFDVRRQQEIDFFTGGSIIMEYDIWPGFIVQTCSFSRHKTLIDGLESCGLLEDYCDVFISCSDSHSDIPIHCKGTTGEQVNNATFLQICSIKKQTHTSSMPSEWVHFQKNIFFAWNIPLSSSHDGKTC